MISLLQLGTIDYATGLTLQRKLVSLRKEDKIGDVLLLLEHKPVITLGRNAKAANIVASPEFLDQRGVELFECGRGGDVTFHGPGQIVGYPIFNLRGFVSSQSSPSRAESSQLSSREEENDSKNRSLESRDPVLPARKHLGVVEFVRRLEDVLMRTCADFSIPTKRLPGLTGVWTDTDSSSSPAHSANLPSGADSKNLSSRAEESDSLQANRSLQSRACPERPTEGRASNGDLGFAESTTPAASEGKLAAIGIHISRFVTSHGFALNVNTDLSFFDLIIPCGITSKPVTSMQKELGRPLDLNAVAESISRNFGVVFQSQILWVETLEALLAGTVGVQQ